MSRPELASILVAATAFQLIPMAMMWAAYCAQTAAHPTAAAQRPTIPTTIEAGCAVSESDGAVASPEPAQPGGRDSAPAEVPSLNFELDSARVVVRRRAALGTSDSLGAEQKIDTG